MSGAARYLRQFREGKKKVCKPPTKIEYKMEPVREHRFLPNKKPLALIR